MPVPEPRPRSGRRARDTRKRFASGATRAAWLGTLATAATLTGACRPADDAASFPAAPPAVAHAEHAPECDPEARRDVSEAEIQELLAVLRQHEYASQGFSALPSAGAVCLDRVAPAGAAPDPNVATIRLRERRGCFSRTWRFRQSAERTELFAAHETYRGEAQHERLAIDYNARSEESPDEPIYSILVGPNPRHIAAVPLEVAQRLGRAWGCLPPTEDVATRDTSGFELYAWPLFDSWGFALVATGAHSGASPRVGWAASAGVENLFWTRRELARLPPHSEIRLRWTTLGPLLGQAAEPPPPPRSLLSRIAEPIEQRGGRFVLPEGLVPVASEAAFTEKADRETPAPRDPAVCSPDRSRAVDTPHANSAPAIRDASEREIRNLLEAVDRRTREREGFSPLPETGAVRLDVWPPPTLEGRGPESFTRIRQERGCFLRRLAFETGHGRPRLRYEGELYEGVSHAGRPGTQPERVALHFRRLDAGDPWAPTRPGAWYEGSRFEPDRIPPELARRLGFAWRCLAVGDPDATVVHDPRCAPSDAEIAASRAAARAIFSEHDLFGWETEDGWRFALVAALSPDGLSPRVLEMREPLDVALATLSELPSGSRVRWIPLSLEGDSASAPRSLVEQLAAALDARGSTLETTGDSSAPGG